MDFLWILLVMGGTFGLCFLADKGFQKVFRGKSQHMSGKSVRLSKKYGSIGLILMVLGVAAMLMITEGGWIMAAGGALVLVIGACLVVYYMTFGVFYDEDRFILTTFGKKSAVYHYRDIRSQQLYNASGSIVIELHLKDGRAVQLQSGMSDVYPFLDTAFAGWCRQKGIAPESCQFHDPDNSCWFPSLEEV